jgi:serine/threonine protein kinase
MDAADNCSKEPDAYIPDTLQQRIDNGQTFSADEILDIASSLLQSIKALHQRNLVHRDIKPSNIIFLQGHCVLTDFGLISANPKTFIGSPGFLAPCPAGGVTLENQKIADLYSLGKIIYCLFSKEPVEHFPLLPQKFSLADFSIIRPLYQKACAVDPRRRFQTCDEFYAAVEKAKASGKNKKRKYIFVTAVILFCLSAALIFAGAYLHKKTTIAEKIDPRSNNVLNGQEAFVKILDDTNGYRILVCFESISEKDADPLYRPNQFKAMKFVKKGIAAFLDPQNSHSVKIKFIRYLKQPFSDGSLMVYLYFINKKDIEIKEAQRRLK